MDFTPTLTAMMGLDYNSSSIGIDFGSVAPGVKKIQVIPDGSYTSHRITERTLVLYTSGDNSIYTVIPRSNWSFEKDKQGVITITLKERVAARYLKVHVKFDERDAGFTAKNKATFLNDLAKMLRVYQEATSQTEEFQYDAVGNRTYQRVTLIRAKSYTSAYYTNSDRLKTDGKYAFVYDAAGNLVNKGNKFNINDDRVTFTQTSGDGVEYWQYTYDLLNRLTEVKKNGTVIAGYEYSPDGLRQVKRGGSGTIHYVFEGTEPIFEKRISDNRVRSYVYVLGKHLARVDGVIGDTAAKAYYYHTDQVGSVKAVTDEAGKAVHKADYFAFGSRFEKDGDFDESHGFTGKEYDSDTGLYYYNARWYDSELGRFISEDPVIDPNNPNLYSYCANNPLTNTDPTGLDVGWYGETNQGGNSGYNDGNYSWSGYSGSGGSGNTGSQSATTTYDPNKRTETVYDDKGIKTSETHYDTRGNLKSTKYYNPNGTVQSEYAYNPDGTISTYTAYNSNGTRTKTSYTYTEYGIIVTTKEQAKGLLGWTTKDFAINGYNSLNDLSNGNWDFTMDNDGDPITSGDLVNGNLLVIACGIYLGYIPGQKERYYKWLSLVNNFGNWDFKRSLDNKRFMFNGVVVVDHVFGNINLAFTAACLGISLSEMKLGGAAFSFKNPNKGENPFAAAMRDMDDWSAYSQGYNFYNSLDSSTNRGLNTTNLSPYQVIKWGLEYFER
jgi:RHS repeat-associated protein